MALLEQISRCAVTAAVGFVILATPAWAQTSPLQAYPPLSRVPQPSDISPAPQHSQEMTVSDPETAIRSAPDEDSPVLGSIGFGTKVTVLDSADGWTHVIAGGSEGYVSSGSLR